MTRPRRSLGDASEPPLDGRADTPDALARRRARLAAAIVSAVRDMPPEVCFRPTRGAAEEAEARQVFYLMQLRMVGDGGSAAAIALIAKAVGRDRATVQHAIEKIEAACEDSPALDLFVNVLVEVALRLEKLQPAVLAALSGGGAGSHAPHEARLRELLRTDRKSFEDKAPRRKRPA